MYLDLPLVAETLHCLGEIGESVVPIQVLRPRLVSVHQQTEIARLQQYRHGEVGREGLREIVILQIWGTARLTRLIARTAFVLAEQLSLPTSWPFSLLNLIFGNSRATLKMPMSSLSNLSHDA